MCVCVFCLCMLCLCVCVLCICVYCVCVCCVCVCCVYVYVCCVCVCCVCVCCVYMCVCFVLCACPYVFARVSVDALCFCVHMCVYKYVHTFVYHSKMLKMHTQKRENCVSVSEFHHVSKMELSVGLRHPLLHFQTLERWMTGEGVLTDLPVSSLPPSCT
jgi:hypothetical protein